MQCRYVLVLLLFLVLLEMFRQRAVINVAILAMVNHTALADINNETFSDECPDQYEQNNTHQYKEGSFIWSQSTQGIILGSYFYGNVFAQLTGGTVIYLLGSKKLLIFSIFLSSLFMVLIPFTANFGVAIVSLVQIIIGLAQGLSYIASFALLGKWSPEKEKSSLTSVCYSGVQVGTLTGMILTGYLCQSGFMGGWPSSFYVFGTSGLALSIFLLFMVYETPEDHPRISNEELLFLQKNIPNISSHETNESIPWKAILTSRAVWVVALTKMCWGYSYYGLVAKLPAYLKIVLHFPIEQNGLINALIYSSDAIMIFLSGFIADFIKKHFSVTTTRKIFETIGMFGTGLGILSVPLFGCDSTKVIIVLTIALGFFGLCIAGDVAIVLDMAPDYAGIIFGFTNGLACLPGIISPYIAGLLLDKDEGDMVQWSYVFYIACTFYFVGALIFLVGASAEVQPWAIKKIIHEEECQDENKL